MTFEDDFIYESDDELVEDVYDVPEISYRQELYSLMMCFLSDPTDEEASMLIHGLKLLSDKEVDVTFTTLDFLLGMIRKVKNV